MRDLMNCRACGLCRERQNVVCPDGDPLSPVAFVGEAPGKKEDETGRPFQGRSGKVLDSLLEEEGVPRSSIFITNTVKCRPPGNRVPTREEMAACLPQPGRGASGPPIDRCAWPYRRQRPASSRGETVRGAEQGSEGHHTRKGDRYRGHLSSGGVVLQFQGQGCPEADHQDRKDLSRGPRKRFLQRNLKLSHPSRQDDSLTSPTRRR